MQGVYIMDAGTGGGGGGSGARAGGGGSITHGGKVALVTHDGSSIRGSRGATRSGSGVRGIYIQEPDFGSSNRGGSGTRRGIDTRGIHFQEPDSDSGTRGGSATRGGISARGGSGTYDTYVEESDSCSAAHATFERQGSEDSSYKCKGKKQLKKERDKLVGNTQYYVVDGSLENSGGKGDGGKDDIGGNRPWIKRCGKKFANGRVHRSAIGGSMGFDEHRIRLGGKVGYDLVFVDTHATKETKKRLQGGEINIKDLEELEFVTQRSKRSFASFQKELEKEYGSTNDQNPNRGDLAVWERLNPDSRGNMFGIGSSDQNFVVNGIQPSFYGCGSYNDVGQSQKVHDVCLELERECEARENLKNHLEQ
ncbi:hypothetical protein QVD17_18694 [Tagetes erecta]|uniref:Uncharacterized protein n=1 Tax=Tagetes erecta TaxID=13708 RepID=A0AAD8NWB1_TARER|nr:hypothetical protein QVD17_18694 [Tagetes erecta]